METEAYGVMLVFTWASGRVECVPAAGPVLRACLEEGGPPESAGVWSGDDVLVTAAGRVLA